MTTPRTLTASSTIFVIREVAFGLLLGPWLWRFYRLWTFLCFFNAFRDLKVTSDTTTKIRDVDAKSHEEKNANEEHIMRASGWVPFSGIVYWGVHTQRGLWHVAVKLIFIKGKILYKITNNNNNMRPFQYFAFTFGDMSDFFADLPFTGKKNLTKVALWRCFVIFFSLPLLWC